LIVNDERSRSEQRLEQMLGAEQLEVIRRAVETSTQASLAAMEPAPQTYLPWRIAASVLPRLRKWQVSVFLAALACGASVAIVGVINLIWDGRAILAAIGAIAIVVYVHAQTRQHRAEQDWVGS
jgi:Flp pilus assembly protein TadB